MENFLNSAFSFPTAVYSVFLGVSAILGLLTIFGLFDLDTGDIGDVGDIGDAGDLAPSPDGDIFTDPHTVTGEFIGVLSRFGLNGVPITIIVALISFFGWLISYHIQFWLLSSLAPVWFVYYPAGLVAFVAALYVATMITAQCCKPLRKIFKTHYAPSKHGFVGQTAVVRDPITTAYGGEAVLNNDGAVLILKIFADKPQRIKRGDKVVLLEYQPHKKGYLVVTEDEFKGL